MTGFPRLLFVYGTLKRGGANHHFLAGQTFLAEARTEPGFLLYELSGYPGMIRDPASRESVLGELWQVDAPCLAQLDELEGIPDGLYRREPVTLSPPHQQKAVETYIYARDVTGRTPIGGHWQIG